MACPSITVDDHTHLFQAEIGILVFKESLKNRLSPIPLFKKSDWDVGILKGWKGQSFIQWILYALLYSQTCKNYNFEIQTPKSATEIKSSLFKKNKNMYA